jgi:2-polyprenyl-3-methyl-5-hydroxy-6-metoxy-1,4-benzoquinol methylase
MIGSLKARLDADGSERRALHELVDFASTDVLEIGCGNGRATWCYADCAASVLAVDPREKDIEHARQHTPEALRGRLTFEAADVSVLELTPGAFDVVLFSRSI